MACCNPKVSFALRVAYSALGIVLGLAVLAVFGVHFNNRHAAGWGLASACFAALTLFLMCYLFVRRELKGRALNRWVLLTTGVLGSVAMTVGVGGFVSYLGIGIIESLKHTLASKIYETPFIVCVWSFMTFKWGFTTYLYSVTSLKYCPMEGYPPVNSGGTL